MNSRIAADTNVLIYLHDKSDQRKRKIASLILSDDPVISSQVVSEYINVTRKLLALSKPDLLKQFVTLFERCYISPVTINTINLAANLMEKYDFQVFDSIIVASALEANCSILYSEDMHDGLKADSLTIVNPFV